MILVLVSVGATTDEVLIASAIVTLAYVVGAVVAYKLIVGRAELDAGHRKVVVISGGAIVIGLILFWGISILAT